MALVQYGGGVVTMSGSIAGDTFARNRFGSYVRARTKPVNPQSSRQVKVRSIVAELTERWYEVLTADQRTAWANYADSIVMKNRLNASIHLTGFNHFIRSNACYLDAVAQYFDDGPTTLTLPDKDPAFAIAATADDQKINVTFNTDLPWNSEPGAGMVFLHGRPQNPTRNFFAGPYRGIVWLGGIQPPGNTSPQEHDAIFTLTADQKIWVKARIIRVDGRISQPFTANCIVAAS